MELLEYKNKVFNLFNCKSFAELPNAIKNSGYTFEIFEEYWKIVGDLDQDWIKHLFQYYQADRVNKKQDFTPNSLSVLLSRLSGKVNVIYDCCAGTGSLTIEKWKDCPEALFICEELDESAIPFLLFNLAIRNINAYVINGNVLTKEVKARFAVKKGKKYASVKKVENFELPKSIDISISNPPYNISWNPPSALETLSDKRFNKCEIPPKNNANYAFILHCLSVANDKSFLILPNGILRSDGAEQEIRKYLIDNNLIESVILLPDKMFEVTTIATCILVLNKKKSNNMISFIDSRHNYSIEVRKQNGQFGGKSHTNRTYLKEYKAFNENQINAIINAILSGESIPEFCISVTIKEVQQKNYDISPSTYIQFKEREELHRSYKDIVSDINFINQQRNACKLVINETLARQFGLDVNSYKENKMLAEKSAEDIKSLLNLKIITPDYITFTKNKNEICIKTNDKEIISFLFERFIKMWGQNIQQFNIFENRYLAELRDAMLPDLMSGKIDVSSIALNT